LLIAVGVPTLFWTAALLLATNSLDLPIGGATLTCFGLVVAAVCLVGASAVMGASEEDQADQGP